MSRAAPGPPRDLAELVSRVRLLEGRALGEVAGWLGREPPPDLRHHKGWIGELVEEALGASAGARAEPDFPHLGVELKTVPVDARGHPRESTWVCAAPMDGGAGGWEGSTARRKLARVLWVPIRGEGPPGERLAGRGRLWSPSPGEEALLRADWEALVELLGLGELWQVDARVGRVLQVRPKAAHGRDRVWALDHRAEWVRTVPRGFYLRRAFTRRILSP